MTTRKLYTRALPILMAIALTAAGCAGVTPQKSPPGEAPVPPAVDVAPPVATQGVAVFYPDWQVQHAIPELRQVPQATGADLATQVVRELLAGPTDPHLNRPFPQGITLLEPVTIADGTAHVNLSKELRGVQGSAGVGAIKMALALSLTDIPGIKRVTVLIEGQREDLHGMAMGPFDRGLYLYPVFPDPERAQYLQGRFAQGLDTWRADPLKVAQLEGRMFGFTAAELEGAKAATQGTKAAVQVTHEGSIYTINLAQTQSGGIWTIQSLDPLTRHTMGGLPTEVRDWVKNYDSTTVGVSRKVGDRTYLVASVEDGAVQIDSVAVKEGRLVVYVTEQGNDRLALASVSGSDAGLPVTFQWKSEPVGKVSRFTAPDALPTVQNPNGLPAARLTGDIAVISPTNGQTVSGSIEIKGYARRLFEAHLVARLLDQQGKEWATANTTAGACCFDWGSFNFLLNSSSAPAGTYRLELGNYSPRDGAWEALIDIPVKIAK